MKKIFSGFLAAICTLPVFGGTIIYKGTNDEKKFVSEIEIISIDRNIITFEIGKTTKTMPLSRMIKYYDNDINMNLAFEDNTSDYDVTVNNMKVPLNLKGTTVKRGKRDSKNVNSISFTHSIQMKTKKNQNKNIKVPYFYLYVLTSSGHTSGRSMYLYCYPSTAKIKSTKTYNEALMFEQAISSSRHVVNSSHYVHGSKVGFSENKITIPLDGIGNRDILAYHLVVWGKDEIVYTENRVLNSRYNVSKNWYLLNRSGK